MRLEVTQVDGISQQQIEEVLRRFIVSETEWSGSARKVTSDFDLIGNGVLDSMGIHQLFSFIRSEFGIEIADEELQLENFESLQRIGSLVASKLVACPAE